MDIMINYTKKYYLASRKWASSIFISMEESLWYVKLKDMQNSIYGILPYFFLHTTYVQLLALHRLSLEGYISKQVTVVVSKKQVAKSRRFGELLISMHFCCFWISVYMYWLFFKLFLKATAFKLVGHEFESWLCHTLIVQQPVKRQWRDLSELRIL